MKKIFAKILICAVLLTFNFIVSQEKETANTSAINEVIKEEPIQVINSKSFYYCALEMTGSYTQHEAAFNTLYQEIGSQGLGLQDYPAGVYWNNPKDTPVEELKWELGILATEGLEVKEPLKLKKWEYPLTAYRNYDGTYDTEEEQAAIKEVYEWIGKNGYVPAGPLVRRFLNVPAKNESGQWTGKSLILVPVQKK